MSRSLRLDTKILIRARCFLEDKLHSREEVMTRVWIAFIHSIHDDGSGGIIAGELYDEPARLPQSK